MKTSTHDSPVDLFIIGGGINGCGIARDAAGRGLSVTLAEMNDLAWATSSASTKLFHGGLRYLEYFEIRLVREALREREVLLTAMPHISWPMRFVLPYHKDMRFENDTPVSKLLSFVMPWMKGRRPAWLIRLGLFMYDHMGARKILPATSTLNLANDPAGAPLDDKFRKAYEYSDCWVQDSRLVALNAVDAANRGANILTHNKVINAKRVNDLWEITTETPDGQTTTHHARALVNAGGPWVKELLNGALNHQTKQSIRLVRGSHIVVPRLFDHDRAYFFQGTDGRIIFAIPYETDFTMIGTTDAEHPNADTPAKCSQIERDYLLKFASGYFKNPVTADQVVWSFAGVRPLYDDGSSSATAATRDYVITLADDATSAPLLNIFGGKITTYRKLAETSLKKLAPFFNELPDNWTAGVPLPGGDFPHDGVDALLAKIKSRYPFLDARWANRLLRTYGTDTFNMLGDAKSADDLGQHFGWSLYAIEVDWLVQNEFAQTCDDILWRRTKLGLHLTANEKEALRDYL
uniref:Glycerol-3-phosphate dehydrogenase n=1 Tax=endosymbiont of Ridgeia piscesae TaxID=54398 RepID=D2CKZ4_9GAMM|nr:aerobic glycerol-3-phosphate dehydrogenase [endosymbiont of Ridgeia piscesae]